MAEKKQVNLNDEEMKTILAEEETGNLCLAAENMPYGIPISYAWIDGRIIIHCSLAGKKMDVIRKNRYVCFTVSRNLERMKPHHAEGKCDYRFESILCFGKAQIVDDPELRLGYLKKFKSFFYKKLNLDDNQDPVTIEAAQKCGCLVIEVEKMTGRRRN
jgi:uncharacterized protein